MYTYRHFEGKFIYTRFLFANDLALKFRELLTIWARELIVGCLRQYFAIEVVG